MVSISVTIIEKSVTLLNIPLLLMDRIEELEEALSVGTDRKFLQKMCQQKQVPETLRPHLWQVSQRLA